MNPPDPPTSPSATQVGERVTVPTTESHVEVRHVSPVSDGHPLMSCGRVSRGQWQEDHLQLIGMQMILLGLHSVPLGGSGQSGPNGHSTERFYRHPVGG